MRQEANILGRSSSTISCLSVCLTVCLWQALLKAFDQDHANFSRIFSSSFRLKLLSEKWVAYSIQRLRHSLVLYVARSLIFSLYGI